MKIQMIRLMNLSDFLRTHIRSERIYIFEDNIRKRLLIILMSGVRMGFGLR